MTDFELLTKDKEFSWEELQQVQYGLNDHMPVEQIAIYQIFSRILPPLQVVR